MSVLKRWDKVLGAVDVPSHCPELAPEYLRFESLGPWMPMPKYRDPFFWVSCDKEGAWHVIEDTFRPPIDRLFYRQGLVHPSKESAEEWISRYGDAWLEDAK